MDKRMLKSICALSVPAVIANVTTPLLAISDVAIMGHIGDAVFIAAIALGGTLFNMVYWLFGFLRMGSSGLTAQAFGAGNSDEQQEVLVRALWLALTIGVAMIVMQRQIAAVAFYFMDADGATSVLAGEYFRICIWGAPAVLGMFVLTGWYVGMQDSRTPMWVSVFIDVFNIGLSVLLVFGFKMEISGVAVGTLMAQWAGFLLGLAVGVRRYGIRWLSVTVVFDAGKVGRFFRINTDIFLRTLCLVAVTVWFTRSGASQGAVVLAANALLMQLFTLFSFFMDGLAFAAEGLCGRFKGAGDDRSLHSAVRHIMVAGGLLAIVFTLLYMGGGMHFMRLLSDDAGVVRCAGDFLVWAVCVPMAGFLAFIWDGVFIGLTRTRSMLLSMCVASAVYFIGYTTLFPLSGNNGLWIAFLLYLFVRGAVLTVIGRGYLCRL